MTASAKTDRRWWYVVFRRLSVYLTWALLHTRVTPNQVTVVSLFVALAGMVFLAQASTTAALVGIAFLVIYHLLDRVDGELARARGIHSMIGIYLDNAGHFVSESGVFLAVTFHLSQVAGAESWLWLIGAGGAVAASLTRMAKHAPFQLYAQYALERPSLIDGLPSGAADRAFTRESAKQERTGSADRSPLGLLRGMVLAWTSFPATLLLFLAGLIMEAVTRETDGLVVILVAAAMLRLLTYMGVEIVNLRQNLGAEMHRLRRGG